MGLPVTVSTSTEGVVWVPEQAEVYANTDGFVSEDGEFLNFAFDDNRHRCVFCRAKLPVTGGTTR